MKTFQELKQYILDKTPDYYQLTDNYVVQIPSKKDILRFHKDTSVKEELLCNIDISGNEVIKIYFPKETIPYEIGYTPNCFDWNKDIQTLLTLNHANAQKLYALLTSL